jgi:hypothetical protein
MRAWGAPRASSQGPSSVTRRPDGTCPTAGAVTALPTASRGEALKAAEQGSETLTVKRVHENPADTEGLMEEVCERENCLQALRRVKRNKGAPGRTG